MFCLVYKSIADPIFEPVQIQEMLEKARVFNETQGITGCLLHYDGVFIQYLEGNQLKVLTLFDKINKDPRHKDLILLSHGYIEKREFKKWEMAFENFMGENDQLQFLRLLVGSYIQDADNAMDPNPTSKFFWRTAKRLLGTKHSERYR
ncbi:BLUF domain-containing protein [Flavobacteriaceae bacterium 3-367]|uniref:BLUF domain-containing protein n=1 Tax=Eudoraea algarum TaxID=3417568 RepID=UPI003280FE1B